MSARRAHQLIGDIMRYEPGYSPGCLYIVLDAVPATREHKVYWLCLCHKNINDPHLDDAGICKFDTLIAP